LLQIAFFYPFILLFSSGIPPLQYFFQYFIHAFKRCCFLVCLFQAIEEEMAFDPSFGEGGGVSGYDVNLDSIAGWLIQKRNSRGAFIGAMVNYFQLLL
jgi:hypothetical protein